MRRGLCGALALLLVGGCASGPGMHRVARNLLIALAAGTAALAVGAAVKSRSVQDDLRRDLDAGTVTGRAYVSRDNEGTRWNRISRASAFSAGVFVLGLAVAWEASVSDHIQEGPAEPTPAQDPRPIFPVPPASSAGWR